MGIPSLIIIRIVLLKYYKEFQNKLPLGLSLLSAFRGIMKILVEPLDFILMDKLIIFNAI